MIHTWKRSIYVLVIPAMMLAIGAIGVANAFWRDGAEGDDDCMEDYEALSIRCMTKHPGAKAMDQLEKSHKLWKAQRAAKGGAGESAARSLDGSINIDVWVHVIRKGL